MMLLRNIPGGCVPSNNCEWASERVSPPLQVVLRCTGPHLKKHSNFIRRFTWALDKLGRSITRLSQMDLLIKRSNLGLWPCIFATSLEQFFLSSSFPECFYRIPLPGATNGWTHYEEEVNWASRRNFTRAMLKLWAQRKQEAKINSGIWVSCFHDQKMCWSQALKEVSSNPGSAEKFSLGLLLTFEAWKRLHDDHRATPKNESTHFENRKSLKTFQL